MSSRKTKCIANSEDAYSKLKVVTDTIQRGELKPWSGEVIDLLAAYNINVERKRDLKVQVTVSFPTSTENRSMAVGVRYAKADRSFAEDLFLFEENVGLTCYYRGTQEKELPEYDETHHHKLELSEFLPDVQRDIADLQRQVKDSTASQSVELITDEMHQQAMRQVEDDFNEQVRSFTVIHGNSSAPQQYSMAARREANKKRQMLQAKKTLSDRVYQAMPPPEITLVINAQANNNRFDVQFVNKSNQTLVAEGISINGVETPLNQQFTKLYKVEQVNSPKDIFDKATEDVTIVVRYATLDGEHFELIQPGMQEVRVGDGRYNVIFPSPSKRRRLQSN